MLAGLDAMQAWSGVDALAQLQPETLVIWGDRDRTYAPMRGRKPKNCGRRFRAPVLRYFLIARMRCMWKSQTPSTAPWSIF